jgi:hypothetical protein
MLPALSRIAKAGSMRHNGSSLSDKPMNQPDAWRMIRRRAAAAGITAQIGCHISAPP